MGDLVLDSLEIQGFRGFRHLQIEKLGRVNLIVGKNNVGKSSLLEALSLYAHEAYPTFIWELLRIRDESTYGGSQQPRSGEVKSRLSHLKYLFYGRKEVRIQAAPILIGPVPVGPTNNGLSINIGWFVRRQAASDPEGPPKLHLIRADEYDASDNPEPRFIIYAGKNRNTFQIDRGLFSYQKYFNINSIFITSNGLDKGLLGDFWDRIVLTDLEEDVIAALRIMAPGVERLSIAGDSNLGERLVEESAARERRRILVPILKISGMDAPIPLRSLGDGMQRILGIALALVNAKDGMLLIDEFENGLHYSVQPDIWRLIFKVAQRLNIQVFATTHSWDCIEAFQKAAQENEQAEGMLISLEKSKSDVEAVLYNEEELKVVTRERIEVR
jgi:energy-coupling factor transporter ATP-binding protein EcfA2